MINVLAFPGRILFFYSCFDEAWIIWINYSAGSQSISAIIPAIIYYILLGMAFVMAATSKPPPISTKLAARTQGLLNFFILLHIFFRKIFPIFRLWLLKVWMQIELLLAREGACTLTLIELMVIKR